MPCCWAHYCVRAKTTPPPKGCSLQMTEDGKGTSPSPFLQDRELLSWAVWAQGLPLASQILDFRSALRCEILSPQFLLPLLLSQVWDLHWGLKALPASFYFLLFLHRCFLQQISWAFLPVLVCASQKPNFHISPFRLPGDPVREIF